MKISARNQWPGVVLSVQKGAVMAEVVVRLERGQEVVSAITATSVDSLGIQVGSPVIVVVKSTEVMIASPE